MFKIIMPAAVLPIAMLALYSPHARADSTCASGKRMSLAQVQDLVAGNYVCLRTADGGIFSNEQHRGSPSSPTGELWDYKMGPTDRNDPTAKVGAYQVTDRGGVAEILYRYNAGSRVYQIVHDTGPYYLFCGVGGEPDVRMKVQPTPGC